MLFRKDLIKNLQNATHKSLRAKYLNPKGVKVIETQLTVLARRDEEGQAEEGQKLPRLGVCGA